MTTDPDDLDGSPLRQPCAVWPWSEAPVALRGLLDGRKIRCPEYVIHGADRALVDLVYHALSTRGDWQDQTTSTETGTLIILGRQA